MEKIGISHLFIEIILDKRIGYATQHIFDHEMDGELYRNKRMEEWDKNKKLRKKYSRERNLNEGFNSYLKQHTGFDSNLPRKGRKSAFFHTTLCLISLNLVALTRLQNGIVENLMSVAYLT